MQRDVACSYLGLQQARLRNKAPAQEKAEVNLALIELGVVSPAPCVASEPEVGFKCTCGFASVDPEKVEGHLAGCNPDEFVCSKCGAGGLRYDQESGERGQRELWWARANRTLVLCGGCDPDSDSDDKD